MDLASIVSSLELIDKVRELIRPKIVVGRSLTGSEDIGNTISIANISATPLLIDYWQLIWIKRVKVFFKKELEICSPEGPDIIDITIQPHTKYLLTFNGMDHFDWGYQTIPNGKLYIRLHICGKRKSVTKLVYDPNK